MNWCKKVCLNVWHDYISSKSVFSELLFSSQPLDKSNFITVAYPVTGRKNHSIQKQSAMTSIQHPTGLITCIDKISSHWFQSMHGCCTLASLHIINICMVACSLDPRSFWLGGQQSRLSILCTFALLSSHTHHLSAIKARCGGLYRWYTLVQC